MAHRPRPPPPPPADAEQYDDYSELERERRENDMRLKSTFEHIFDKYERDFTDIGDEIDLETGEIIVNNGHLARLEDERDTGEDFEEWYEEDDENVDDVTGSYSYERHAVAGSLEEDELLSSPPGNRDQCVSLPGGALASLSKLTSQMSTIHPPPAVPTPHYRSHMQPRNRSQHLNTPQRRDQPQHRNPPCPSRTRRPGFEAQQTPHRMNMTEDPAFFQALGQSIAQGIAQYMSSYQDSPRSTDPVWDAPPLPRPSHSARRSAPSPQRRPQMIPESPRQPSKSLWSTGRAVGRPRLQARPSTQIPDPSPSVRNSTLRRQTLANDPPARPRYAEPQWDEVDYEGAEESFEELEGNGSPEEDMGDIECEDQNQVNAWAEDEEVMDLESAANGEDPIDTTETEDVKNPHPYQALVTAPTNTQVPPASRTRPDSTPTTEASGTANSGTTGGRDAHATPVAQPSPEWSTAQTPLGSADRKNNKQLPWIEGDNELFIVLKEDRKLAFSQIGRYFPGRNCQNLMYHWYQRLANRPDKTRGPMSDYVRQALERGPILANKVRQKPYVPKNPETACPHRANLADPTEILERYPIEVPDSEQKAESPKLVPPGVDITTGRPAPFNPNILIREEMERTHLCTLCGKSWVSHSNARRHTRLPELCRPENWLANYMPGAHRKRALVQIPANKSTPEDRPSKRQKTDDSATPRLLEAAKRRAPQVPLNDSPVGAGVQRAAVARSPDVVQPAKEVMPLSQDARPESVSAPQRGSPKHFTISDKQPVAAGPSRQMPIDPRLIDTSKVMEAVQQHMGVPQQVLGISPLVLIRRPHSAVRMTDGETSATGAAAAVRDRISSSNNDVQTPSAQKQTADKTPMEPVPPLTQPLKSRGRGRPPSQNTKGAHQVAGTGSTPRNGDSATTQLSKASQKSWQRSDQITGASSTPRGQAPPTSDPVPTTPASKSRQKPWLPKPSPTAMPDARMKATPSRPGLKSVAPQASQSSRPAIKAASAKRLLANTGPAATPRTKVTGEASQSSPLGRIARSEPRPSTRFVDLLADMSEDELAL
ncbi:myb-like dna-binding domain protein [Diplodia corticola]|uniref:Myb-like dna-binding domain protein n=1 Tax=Diplodia corticola TaxID=236234 RepID=A0A1J9RZU6_9PEZI|nr:myb-like dna-binding domain protein [Diplodia corticola]OJD33871.1 myb-like dna-binding domain protein [Diplodia corticola]